MNDRFGNTPAILIAGGQPFDDKAFKAIIAPELNKFPNPRIAYIGTANGDREGFFDMIYAMFKRAGAQRMDFLRLAREDADIAGAAEALIRSDIIFLSGGEVDDGIDWLRKHGLVDLLKEQFRNGKLFIGLSAGAIMIGAYWVRVGIPEDDGATEKLQRWVAGDLCPEVDANIELFECLGLVPATFDTHAENEGWVELKAALRLKGNGARGYGIPRGGIIKANGRGDLINLEREYLTFTYENGEYSIT